MKNLLNRMAESERRYSDKYINTIAVFFLGFLSAELFNNWNALPEIVSRSIERIKGMDIVSLSLYLLVVTVIFVLCLKSIRNELAHERSDK